MSTYCASAHMQSVQCTKTDRSRRRARHVSLNEAGRPLFSSRFSGCFVADASSVQHRHVLDPRPSAMDDTSGALQSASTSGVLRIVLMRHADSESASASTTDFERPVTASGASKVQSIARSLKMLGYIPNLFLSSNSARSRQTHTLMIQAMPELEGADAHFFGSLYTESQLDGHTLPHLMELIRSLGDVSRHSCVLCLGHNKGWEEAASALAGEKVVLKNGDAALFEMDVGAHGWDQEARPMDAWKNAMSRVGQKSGWRFKTLLTK